MAYDILIKEAEALPEEQIQEVLDFILFLKTKTSGNRKEGGKRKLGVFKEEPFFMAEDFDDTPECFKEYI